ncbi:MAG: hypothetical protein E7365_04400 [Clostridiales bacterium]|nr:hypothetical protein [Clostridiales bacterium]
MENKQTKSFSLMFLITTPKLEEKAEHIFKEFQIPLLYRFNAEGTASSEIMDMLGLGSIDKCIFLSMFATELTGPVFEKLKDDMPLYTVNSGIAFTIQLNGANNLTLKMLTKNAEDNESKTERKVDYDMTEHKHVLITAVVDRGFSGDVMEAAKGAGAKGGTVILSRRIENDEAVGFWGLSVQEEKEIVMIIAKSEDKLPIMQSISDKCGMHSEAKGLVMSSPIDAVVGM